MTALHRRGAPIYCQPASPGERAGLLAAVIGVEGVVAE
jgi:hypothetical protein